MHIFKKGVFIGVLIFFSFHVAQTTKRLSDYKFNSASVLPTYIHNNQKYIILGCEAFGSSKNSYDDFGGGREKTERHPLLTAAREFFEESISEFTLGLSLYQIRKYIDLHRSQETEIIIAAEKNVTYITNFNAYVDQLFKNFFVARSRVTDKHYREKKALAIIKWKTLKQVICSRKYNTNVTIEALVLDKTSPFLHKQEILLRRFFVKKVRSFFMGQTYRQGQSKKIRFYN